MRRTTWLLALMLAAAVLVAAGCGGDDSSGGSSGSSGTSSDSSSSSSGAGSLTVTADPGGAISWDKSSLSAKAGKVTLKLVNDSQTQHGIAVEGNGVDKDSKTVTGGTADVTADLKPGTYEFYCPVPGHKATMHGTLTVS